MPRSVRMVTWSGTLISHPLIIPPIEHINDVMPFDDEVPVNDVSRPLPTVDVDDQHRMQMITIIMDNLMDLVNPDGDVFIGLLWKTHIACGGPIIHYYYFYVLFIYYV